MALTWAAAAGASAEPLQERMRPCLLCHGENGQSGMPETPSLGGQGAPYLLIQIFLFREGLRRVEIMNDAVKGFTDADLQAFADALARLPAPRPTERGDPARLARGELLVRRYRCNFCHSDDLSGRDNVPRIAGQREDFLIKTLREYKSNRRAGYDASMAEVLEPIADNEILELAYFAARQGGG
jgi:cytochrome c553